MNKKAHNQNKTCSFNTTLSSLAHYVLGRDRQGEFFYIRII